MADNSPSGKQLTALQKAAIALKEMRSKLEAMERAATEPIAIVGMSGRFPGASSCDDFWQLLHEGVDATVDIPAERWSLDQYYDPNPNAPGKMNTRRGAFVAGVDQFDPAFFGISAREAVKMDPQQRLLLEVTWEALENAGQSPERLAGTRTGMYIGINQMDYGLEQVGQDDRMDIYTTTGNGFCFTAGRISFTLGLQGPNMAIDTACSSSLVAVHLACQGLRAGECNTAVAGGVQLNLIPTFHLLLAKARSLSPSGRCNSFDAAADGLILGEGCGVVVLKRLSDASANGDRILALIRGSGVNHGGPSSGITVPNELAQETLIRQVLEKARVNPAEVDYIETHGTGTSLGDPIEVGALSAVFRDRPKDRPLVLGAVKTNIGHLDAAAGIAGLVKAVLCLQHGQIPRNLHFNEPNPQIDWDACPLKVPTEPHPWPRGEKRRMAGVSSFGISGTNAHVLLAEAPETERADKSSERPRHLFTLSAKCDKALSQLAQAYAHHLEAAEEGALADICFTANAGRSHFNHRMAAVVDSVRALQEELMAFDHNGKAARRWHGSLPERGREKVKVVFLFGEAAREFSGLGQQLYATQAVFRKAIDRCSAVLEGRFDLPLSAAFAAGERQPEPNSTAYRHAAFFALEYALAELWQSWAVRPAAVIGRGVGEYAAACVAGVFGLEDSLQLVVLRGELQEQTAPSSAPGSGADLGAFGRTVDRVIPGKPRLSMVSGSTGQMLTPDSPLDAEYWRRHARTTESGAAGIETLVEKGYQSFLEMGLRSLPVERALAAQSGELVYLPSLEMARDEWETLLPSLAQLYVCGLDIDWERFDQDFARQRQALPTYPFQRQRYWLEREDREVAAEPLRAAEDRSVATDSADAGSTPAHTAAARPEKQPAPRTAAAAGPETETAPGRLHRIMAQQLQVSSNTLSQVVAQQLEFLRGSQAKSVPDPVRETSAAKEGTSMTTDRAAEPPEIDTGAVQTAAEPPETDTAVVQIAAEVRDERGEGEWEADEEEARAPERPARGGWQLLLISAPSEAELDDQTEQLVEELKQSPGRLAEIARTWQRRDPLPHCRALVCQDADDAIATLASLDPKRVATRFRESLERPVAFMFPGVGDHYVNMAREFYQTEPVFRKEIDTCCEWMAPHLGEDLREILYPEKPETAEKEAGPASFDLRKMLNRAPADENSAKLAKTLFNQPAVFTVEYALARLWMSWGIAPQAIIGYSVGEYVAACLSGVMSLDDALLLLIRRAQMIQELPAGSMLAVPLAEDELRPLLGEELSIAITSTPAQCVLAGPPEAIAQLERQLTEREVLCRQLPTTHAFHSKMMEELREPITEVAGSIRLNRPQIPFVSNVTGTWISSAQATDPHYWAQHTYQTVRFADGVGELLQSPNRILLEIGPGQNLGSFVFQHPQFKQAQDCLVLPSLRNVYDRQSDRVFLLNTLGKLWLGGMDLDWARVLG